MKKQVLIWMVLVFGCRTDSKTTATKISVIQQLPASITVRSTDTALQLKNGVWYYRQNPLSGNIETYYATGKLAVQQGFYMGKEEGMAVSYYENGHKDAVRYYHLGEKDSVHNGWWPNGQPRFEYHFKMGVYDGDFKEWYESGKPMKYIVYAAGKEQQGKGWRENGKTYMSFVVRNGRLYGLINPNLCYSLKNEKGEYINSPK